MTDSEWINVRDRLPQNGNNVLVWLEYEHAKIGRMHYGKWLVNVDNGLRQSRCGHYTVTHWQPLPEGPKD